MSVFLTTPGRKNGHRHSAEQFEDGTWDVVTSFDDDHEHEIDEDGNILEADQHTHEIEVKIESYKPNLIERVEKVFYEIGKLSKVVQNILKKVDSSIEVSNITTDSGQTVIEFTSSSSNSPQQLIFDADGKLITKDKKLLTVSKELNRALF